MNLNEKLTKGICLPDLNNNEELRTDDIAVIMREALKKLYHHFDVRDISKRPGSKGMTLYYLEGYKMIDFMNYHFGLDWSSECGQPIISEVTCTDKNGNALVKSVITVNCTVTITLRDSNGDICLHATRPGIGADTISNHNDVDKSVKTAMINGIKKAFIMFGMTSYLWIAEERDAIEDGLKAVQELTQNNIDKISFFSVNNGLSQDDRKGLLEDVFKNGIKLSDGTLVKGVDASVFKHPKQNEIVDYFIKKSSELIHGEVTE